MALRKKSPGPSGPPKWWETMAGAPLAYFLLLAGLFGVLVLMKRLFSVW